MISLASFGQISNAFLSNAKDLNSLKSSKGKSIFFDLSYDYNRCFVFEGIDFYTVRIILISKDYLCFEFGVGIKDEIIYTVDLPYRDFVKPFFFLSEKRTGIEVNTVFSTNRYLVLNQCNDCLGVNCFEFEFFDLKGHVPLSKYIIKKFFFSLEEGFYEFWVYDTVDKIMYKSDYP